MKVDKTASLTHGTLIWIFVAQLGLAASYVSELSYALILVVLISAAWRYRILKGGWGYPGWQLKAMMVLLSMGAIALSPLEPISLEAATALLVLGFALKNLELVSGRDAIVLVYIGYFLITVRFLYSQTIFTTVSVVILLWILTSTLISIQLGRSFPVPVLMRLSARMLLLSMPLMVVGYLLFPRLPPLWSVPAPTNQAISGVTDEMSPGDIASIAGSGKLAFRVTFDGPAPEQVKRYWRGPVLHEFDGRTWRPGVEFLESSLFSSEKLKPENSVLFSSNIRYQGPGSVYHVLYEPNQQRWAFSLPGSRPLSDNLRQTFDGQIISESVMQSPVRIKLQHYPEAIRQFELSARNAELDLQLPDGINPETRAYVKRMLQDNPDTADFILAILEGFQRNQFFYTLRPPLLSGPDQVDQFLFQSKRGFCAHYASAFTVMMRMAGIPSRVVTGYQGGEWNESGSFIAVRQFDAHAWSEVWLPGRGWIQLDPTAWVAPSRIEQSLRDAVADEESFLGDSPFYALQFSTFNALRLRLESLQFRWQRWVLNYDQQDQTEVFYRFFGGLNATEVIWKTGAMIVVILTFWSLALGLLKPVSRVPGPVKEWYRLLYQLEKQGIRITSDTSPSQLPELIRQAGYLTPPAINAYLKLINQGLYQSAPVAPGDRKRAWRLAMRSRLKMTNMTHGEVS